MPRPRAGGTSRLSDERAPVSAGAFTFIRCVDDHAIVLAGLVALLETEPDMSGVGSATKARQGIEEFRKLRPMSR